MTVAAGIVTTIEKGAYQGYEHLVQGEWGEFLTWLQDLEPNLHSVQKILNALSDFEPITQSENALKARAYLEKIFPELTIVSEHQKEVKVSTATQVTSMEDWQDDARKRALEANARMLGTPSIQTPGTAVVESAPSTAASPTSTTTPPPLPKVVSQYKDGKDTVITNFGGKPIPGLTAQDIMSFDFKFRTVLGEGNVLQYKIMVMWNGELATEYYQTMDEAITKLEEVLTQISVYLEDQKDNALLDQALAKADPEPTPTMAEDPTKDEMDGNHWEAWGGVD